MIRAVVFFLVAPCLFAIAAYVHVAVQGRIVYVPVHGAITPLLPSLHVQPYSKSVKDAVGPYECNMLTSDPVISCLLPFPSDFFNAQWWNSSAPPGLTMTEGEV